MWDKYYIAATLIDALDLLTSTPDKSKVVAGSTDLILEIERGLHRGKTTIIDISRIPGLDTIVRDEKGNIHIGALVTHNQVAASPIIQTYARCLAEASYQVGSPQIRNRGTVAGNVITASPANDTISPLIVLDAELVLVSKQGERRLKVEDFYTGVRHTKLKDSEICVEIIIPSQTSGSFSTFYKYALRNAQAISLVNAAVSVEMHENRINQVRIAVGAVAPTVVRLKNMESAITGKKLSDMQSFDFIVATKEISPISDIRSSDQFRSEMVQVIVKRCFDTLAHTDGINRVPPLINPITLTGANQSTLPPITNTYLVDKKEPIMTRINGKEYIFQNAYQKSLLDLVRDDAGLIGSKEGCAEGECGACTMYLDGKAVMSCLVPAPRAHLAEITTIEGIAAGENLHPVQEAFITEGAVQCGYCTPGFIMSAVKLLEERQNPTESEIKEAITGNLCRCTGYYKIIRAIEKAASNGGSNGQT